MATASLHAGSCPKCGSSDVYTTRSMPKRGERAQIAVSSFSTLSLDTYLCLGCGHFEELVSQEDLVSNAEKIRATWNKA